MNNPDFDKLCNDVSKMQRLTKSGNKCCKNDKEVNLSSVDGNGIFCKICFNCGKASGYHAMGCRKRKGDLKVAVLERVKGEILAIVALRRCAIFEE